MWCAQNYSASCFPMVPGSADLFTYMSSLSEVTGSYHSLPVWHYLRYFSGSKAPFSSGPYLLWKTHFVTMEGRAGTQPPLGHTCSFSDSGMWWAEVCFRPHQREWLEVMGCGRGFMGLTGKLDDCGIEWQPVSYMFFSLSHAFRSCLHSSCIQSRSPISSSLHHHVEMMTEDCRGVLFKVKWFVLIQNHLTGSLFVDSHALVFQGTVSNAHQMCLTLRFFSTK